MRGLSNVILKPFDLMNGAPFVFLRAKFRSKNSSLGYKLTGGDGGSYSWAALMMTTTIIITTIINSTSTNSLFLIKPSIIYLGIAFVRTHL